jgi:hypothetical protein
MKKTTILFIGLLLTRFAIGQDLQWAKSIMNPNAVDFCYGIASNGNDRMGIIGMVYEGSPINWDNGPGNPNWTMMQFVAVYNHEGAYIWSNPVPGYPYAIAQDATGNTYVAGRFSGTVDFDPSSEVFQLNSTGSGYIVKYNALGEFQWAVKDDLDGHISRLTVGDNGKIYYAGEIGINTVATLNGGQTIPVNIGAFIGEISESGTLEHIWNIEVPITAQYIYVKELLVKNGALYIAGNLDGVADFDVSSGVDQNPQTNSYDAWLVKYNLDSGISVAWKKVIGAQGWDYLEGLEVDDTGNVFCSGTFTWTVDFSPENTGLFQLTSDTNTGAESGFIMKYNASGEVQWVRKIGNENSTGSIDIDEASVFMRDLCLTQDKIMILLEGEGQILMDGVSSVSNIPTGSIAAPGLVIGEYDIDGNWISACNVDTIGAPLGFFGGLSAVGLKPLQGNRWVVAGTFLQKLNFGNDVNPFYLQTDPNSTNYGFDKDVYVACYSGSEGVGLLPIVANEAAIKVSNPTKDNLEFFGIVGDYTWRIFGLDGKLLANGNQDSNQIGALDTGLFILEVTTANGVSAQMKVVKLD